MRLTISLMCLSVLLIWLHMGAMRCQALYRLAASPHSKPRLCAHLLKQKNAHIAWVYCEAMLKAYTVIISAF